LGCDVLGCCGCGGSDGGHSKKGLEETMKKRTGLDKRFRIGINSFYLALITHAPQRTKMIIPISVIMILTAWFILWGLWTLIKGRKR